MRYLIIGIVALMGIYGSNSAYCQEVYTIGQLADAIYWAEGGAGTTHPYGILAHYKHTTPRQACINTIHSAKHRYEKLNLRMDFIEYLGKTYCPTKGIYLTKQEKCVNIYWVKNVKYFLKKGEKADGQR